MTWLRDLYTLQNEMNRLFGDTLASRENVPPSRAAAWVPPVDIHETKDAFTIEVELPGVKKQDVTLELQESSLVLKGERRQERDVKEGATHRTERVYGYFQRSFSLPTNVNTAAVKASFKDGVLEIVLPKAEEAKPRQINIAA